MLAIKDALMIKNFVNGFLFEGEDVLSLEDAANMHPIPGARHDSSYTILSIQVGTQTILVWVQFTDRGLRVRGANKQSW